MLIRIFIILLLAMPNLCKAQSDTHFRDSVLSLFGIIRYSPDSEKVLAAIKLETMFTEYYSDSENFGQELDSVPFLGQLSSSDGKVKMLCWNLALENGEFRYHCVLRHRPDRKTVSVTVLQDNDSDWGKLLRKPLQPRSWYGVLYYRILTDRYRGRTYYTLLGWDGKDPVTNRKIVDVLTIRKNRSTLGANMFRADRRPAYRLIYEYADDATMSLNFDEKEKMIVMDHLAPEDSRLEGQYQFYGPDFSYDGLEFKKGKWVLRTDIFTKNRGLNNLPKNRGPESFTD